MSFELDIIDAVTGIGMVSLASLRRCRRREDGSIGFGQKVYFEST